MPQRISQIRKISSRQVFAVILATVLLAQCPESADASVRLCGNKLTSALELICKHKICGGISKRGVNPFYLDELLERNYDPFTYYSNRVRRSRIVTECCAKRCTLDFLKTFCCAETDDSVNLDGV
ncbi:unnamed protein product [Bursaphelenchus xylophilus]|uniref:(pine wood nematode) hypothetical protein n=1 Tax=Bursaphelenchus xylophilus TaxID=6326 RepID=A0A1I7SUM1_BURXY|nr:unnamed protein product [Bursaphelenchus xylophilus]CAG9118570.1 unnamed protein product [Bursaphelenchus xylophilus]